MFVQSNAIRDYVFPLCEIECTPKGLRITKFLGSAFLIGGRSFALTTTHVVEQSARVSALFVVEDQWCTYAVTEVEQHPYEDISLLKIDCLNLKSIFRMNDQIELSSQKYKQFAYPDDMMYELMENGRAIGRPDLVYLEGYIRRRTNHIIPTIKGTALFEISEVGGTGCSGSPIFKIVAPNEKWNVLGIYVAERLNDRGTNVSYAVREDAFREWAPSALGCTVRDECED